MLSPTITKPTTRPALGLTDRGRMHAILIELDRRWAMLTDSDKARARGLLAELAATYRA